MSPIPNRALSLAAALLVALAALLCLAALEREERGLGVERMTLGGTPVTLRRPEGAAGPLPLVLVAHGYAGSRQMMDAISIRLAHAGLAVASFDFHGHGRHPLPMDADITSLEGATAQLVAQTEALALALRARADIAEDTALLGHSMATDIVIRAARPLQARAVVAISMYSDAVTASDPARLLIVSGAQEGRLREVALGALRMVDPDATEGTTARSGDTLRRAVAAPLVGHVGVLYHPATLSESEAWILRALDLEPSMESSLRGLWTAMLLASIVAAIWPVTWLLAPMPPAERPPLPRLGARRASLVLAAPAAAGLGAALLAPGGVLGLSAFGPLAALLAGWGAVQLALLPRSERASPSADFRCAVLFLAWGAVFALALDRYGAAFLPSGPRLGVMALLLPGAVLLAIADARLARQAGFLLLASSRLLLLVLILGAMVLRPSLGPAFTVIPVTLLFWLVYGTAAGRLRGRGGGSLLGGAVGVFLAFAWAASTPLISV